MKCVDFLTLELYKCIEKFFTLELLNFWTLNKVYGQVLYLRAISEQVFLKWALYSDKTFKGSNSVLQIIYSSILKRLSLISDNHKTDSYIYHYVLHILQSTFYMES